MCTPFRSWHYRLPTYKLNWPIRPAYSSRFPMCFVSYRSVRRVPFAPDAPSPADVHRLAGDDWSPCWWTNRCFHHSHWESLDVCACDISAQDRPMYSVECHASSHAIGFCVEKTNLLFRWFVLMTHEHRWSRYIGVTHVKNGGKLYSHGHGKSLILSVAAVPMAKLSWEYDYLCSKQSAQFTRSSCFARLRLQLCTIWRRSCELKPKHRQCETPDKWRNVRLELSNDYRNRNTTDEVILRMRPMKIPIQNEPIIEERMGWIGSIQIMLMRLLARNWRTI